MLASSTIPGDVESAVSKSPPTRGGQLPPILEVENLCVETFQLGLIPVPILDAVTLKIMPGEIMGILGESGCGKTTLSRAMVGILPPGMRVISGSVRLESQEFLEMPERSSRTLRGNTISLIHQEVEGALHPLMRVRDQVAEILRAHRAWNYRTCRNEADDVLQEVFGGTAIRIGNSYPHELSGGQRQRVLLAQATACRPKIVIADEPTASLDVATQAEILSLLRRLNRKYGMAVMLITHNPAVLRQLARQVIVMYAGRIIEQGDSEAIFANPLHPYTGALLSMERRGDLGTPVSKSRLPTIPGNAPDQSYANRGCRFEPRCAVRLPMCTVAEPALLSVSDGREVRCVLYE